MISRPDDSPQSATEGSGRQLSSLRKRRLRRTIAWTASALVFVLLLGGGYVAYNYFHFVGGVTKVGGVISGKNVKSGSAQNILLIGNDERPANMTAAEYAELNTTPDGNSANTDTTILVHVPANGSSATLVSFPRDVLVTIPGYGKAKLNAAYVYGQTNAKGTQQQKDAAGVKLLIRTIQGLTGLRINHYVKVSLLSFYNIATALGPVTVCLNEATSDGYSGAHFKAGTQALTASQALSFVRQRHDLPNGDLDRAVRQQYFLSVEAQRILTAGTLLNPVKLNKVVTAISSSLETDDQLNLLSLATQLKGLRSGGIRSATIPLLPAPNTFSTVPGIGDVDNIDFDALPDFIATVTGRRTAAQRVASAKAASPGAVSVDVLNGADTPQGSSTALATLAQLGFHTGRPADASSAQQRTTVYFPAGQEAQAKSVLRYLPGAAVAQSSEYKRVTVILGADGVMPVVSPPTASSSSSPSHSSASTRSATPSPSTSSYSTSVCVN